MSLLNRLNRGLVNSATIDQLMELLNEWDPRMEHSISNGILKMRKHGGGRIYTSSYFLNQVAGEYSDMLRAAGIKGIYFDGETDIIIARDMNLDKNIVIKSDRDIYFVKGRKSTKVTISELNLKCRTLYIGNNGIEITQSAFTCRAIDDPYDCLTGDCEVNYI